ncbi:hypothetical protein HDU67_010436, partial [Dinochytrium kinnereticum]
VTKDIDNFGKKRGLRFTRVSPPPPPQQQQPVSKTSPINYGEIYKDRYCQVFDGEVVPDARGEHGEPVAERGVKLIYLPLLGNGGMREGFSPSDFSFGKLGYEGVEVQELLECARLDFLEGVDRMRETLRGVWEEKRMARMNERGIED